jgi:hypothetical protein
VLTVRSLLLFLFLFYVSPFAWSEQANEQLGSHKRTVKKDPRGSATNPLFVEVIESQEAKARSEDEKVEKQGKAKADDDLAIYTGQLAEYTFGLVTIGVVQILIFIAQLIFIWRQEIATRVHERAYMIGGGPLPSTQTVGNIQFDTTEKYMTIENWGRTPGFVTKVQWGLCPGDDFPANTSISEAIKTNLFPAGVLQNVEFSENIYPPGSGALIYRHVFFNTNANVGKIFFGRIVYKDVFKVPHHSTFKLLITENISEPLEGSYSEDWS